MDKGGYTKSSARKALLRAFLDKEKLFEKQDNVFYGGKKVFVINSVLAHSLDLRAKKIISLTEVQHYVSLIQQYIDDQIDLCWQDNKLMIKVIGPN
jgi:hypothetical protein